MNALLQKIRTHANLTKTNVLGLFLVLLAPTFVFASSLGDDILDGINNVLQVFVKVFGMFLGFAGILLNGAAFYSVVQMGALMNELMPLQVAWATFRDLGNLVLIFAFISIAITTMLNADSHGTNKRLVTLVIVAVTINFSALAARAVIDVGNITAVQFYKAMNGGNIPNGVSNNGLSASLVQSLQLQTLQTQAAGSTGVSNYPFIAIMTIILFTIVIIVFLAISIMLVARMVVLILLITVSPLAFAAMVLPKFESASRKWWDMLLNQTMTAPAMLFIVLISTKMLVGSGKGTALTNLIANNNWSGLSGQTDQLMAVGNIAIVFMIAIGFYLSSLVAGKQLGAIGANFAIKTATSIGSAPLLPFRGIARGTVNGFGKAGSERWDKFMGNRGRVTGGALRLLGIDDAVKNSFEKARNAKIGGSTLEENQKHREHREHEAHEAVELAELKAQLDKGEELSPEMKALLQRRSTKQLLQLKGIKEGKASYMTNLTQDQYNKLKNSDDVTTDQKRLMKKGRDELYKGLNQEMENIGTAFSNSNELRDLTKENKDLLRRMSTDELMGLDGVLKGELGYMMNITQDQFDKIMSSDKVDAATKKTIKEARDGLYKNTKGLVLTNADGSIKNDAAGNAQTGTVAATAIKSLSAGKIGEAALASEEAIKALSLEQMRNMDPSQFSAEAIQRFTDVIRLNTDLPEVQRFNLALNSDRRLHAKWSPYLDAAQPQAAQEDDIRNYV